MLARVSIAEAARTISEFRPSVTESMSRRAWKRAYPGVSLTGRQLPPRATGSTSEAAALWLAEHRTSTFEAGELFGVTHQAVSFAWHRLFPGREVPNREAVLRRKAEIAERAQRGESAAAIADALGMSINSVYNIARRIGVPFAGPIGARREQQRRAIAEMLERGLSIMDVAVELGIGHSAVAYIAKAVGVTVAHCHSGRHDGRMARAIERVRNGETVTAACRAERCATPPVYVATKEMRSSCK